MEEETDLATAMVTFTPPGNGATTRPQSTVDRPVHGGRNPRRHGEACRPTEIPNGSKNAQALSAQTRKCRIICPATGVRARYPHPNVVDRLSPHSTNPLAGYVSTMDLLGMLKTREFNNNASLMDSGDYGILKGADRFLLTDLDLKCATRVAHIAGKIQHWDRG
ncbi:hypothetical protein BD779DRAFT_1475881 [Infundibulicybe gibba]|nr:hypothetical protein BD779DRAFT_1475881 [Infundibulicybe gibba]